jgi:hypothetical protein
MEGVGGMVRKLRAMLEVVRSNSRGRARAFTSENFM